RAQCSSRPKFHPSRALNERFDHDSRNLRNLSGGELFERFQIRNLNRRKIPAARADLKHRRSTQAGRAGRVTVITVLKRDELVSSRILQAPILIRDPQRDLDSGRAVIGVKNATERVLWEKIDNRRCKFDRPRIRESKKRGMRDALEL